MTEADYVKVPIRKRGVGIVAYAKADPDFPMLDARWYFDRDRYVATRLAAGGPLVYMHRVVLGLTKGDGLEADHLNGDRSDNRRSNLRALTHAQNNQNVPSRGGTSRFRGVSWHKQHRKWIARARVGGTLHHLGLFECEEDAGAAAAAFRAEHMPFSTEARAVRARA